MDASAKPKEIVPPNAYEFSACPVCDESHGTPIHEETCEGIHIELMECARFRLLYSNPRPRNPTRLIVTQTGPETNVRGKPRLTMTTGSSYVILDSTSSSGTYGSIIAPPAKQYLKHAVLWGLDALTRRQVYLYPEIMITAA